MKSFSIFESSIIGFFVGVIVSTYLMFLISMESYIGKIISTVSLKPLLDSLNISQNRIWIASFIFFIIVYTIYGAITGIIAKYSKKGIYAILVIILLAIVGSVFEQIKGAKDLEDQIKINALNTASAYNAVVRKPKTPPQYFGTEKIGDLNSDSKDDVAFIINRDDAERGTLYYLATSLKTDKGYSGTNLIFLGEKIEIKNLNIENGLIVVDYEDISKKKDVSTTTATTTFKTIYAEVINGKLEKKATTTETKL